MREARGAWHLPQDITVIRSHFLQGKVSALLLQALGALLNPQFPLDFRSKLWGMAKESGQTQVESACHWLAVIIRTSLNISEPQSLPSTVDVHHTNQK